jgi:hypothetical protein
MLPPVAIFPEFAGGCKRVAENGDGFVNLVAIDQQRWNPAHDLAMGAAGEEQEPAFESSLGHGRSAAAPRLAGRGGELGAVAGRASLPTPSTASAPELLKK